MLKNLRHFLFLRFLFYCDVYTVPQDDTVGSVVSHEGLYRQLTAELDIDALAVNTLLQSQAVQAALTIKNPLKMFFFCFFFNFTFCMKIIQTFLFETDFL
jgi:hypothetical protein